jgi:hypothetical protein
MRLTHGRLSWNPSMKAPVIFTEDRLVCYSSSLVGATHGHPALERRLLWLTARHKAGDWSIAPAAEQAVNAVALTRREFVLSVFPIDPRRPLDEVANHVWIVTPDGWEMTELMFAEEFRNPWVYPAPVDNNPTDPDPVEGHNGSRSSAG